MSLDSSIDMNTVGSLSMPSLTMLNSIRRFVRALETQNDFATARNSFSILIFGWFALHAAQQRKRLQWPRCACVSVSLCNLTKRNGIWNETCNGTPPTFGSHIGRDENNSQYFVYTSRAKIVYSSDHSKERNGDRHSRRNTNLLAERQENADRHGAAGKGTVVKKNASHTTKMKIELIFKLQIAVLRLVFNVQSLMADLFLALRQHLICTMTKLYVAAVSLSTISAE